MKYQKHSDKFKEQVVKEYLSGEGQSKLVRKYEINKSQIQRWTIKWKEYGSFPDGRGKGRGGGRPRKINIDEMTKDEYIAYLEMENDILKQLRSLGNKK